jgi:DNA-binding transcriptional regulator YhcF (GntR family)
MAQDAAVNPNTMQKALSELERSGLVYTNRTSGRFITSDEEMIKNLKGKSAREQIMEFLERMKQHGFTPQETLALVMEIVKTEN